MKIIHVSSSSKNHNPAPPSLEFQSDTPITSEDQLSLQLFFHALRDHGVQARILDIDEFRRNVCKQYFIGGHSTEPTQKYILDICKASIETMHEAGYSIARLYDIVLWAKDHAELVPSSFMPSQAAIDQLETQFWSYVRNKVTG